MNETQARAMVGELVGAASMAKIEQFLSLLTAENERQNLIARSTIPSIWSRHVLDSVQLLALARKAEGPWIDVGTGGGFPGLIIAITRKRPIILVEPRQKRAAFLEEMLAELALTHARVAAVRIERLEEKNAAVISARAVASIGSVLELGRECASPTTQWILPRGEAWHDDLQGANKEWQGRFHVEQSLSNPAARIIVATGVARR